MRSFGRPIDVADPRLLRAEGFRNSGEQDEIDVRVRACATTCMRADQGHAADISARRRPLRDQFEEAFGLLRRFRHPAILVERVYPKKESLRHPPVSPSAYSERDRLGHRHAVTGVARNGVGWAVVMTKPSTEQVVEVALRRAGWRTYTPRYRKILRGVKIVGGYQRVRTRGHDPERCGPSIVDPARTSNRRSGGARQRLTAGLSWAARLPRLILIRGNACGLHGVNPTRDCCVE